MSIKQCLIDLGLTVTQEGGQLVTTCYLCGDNDHAYYDQSSGVFHCKKCSGGGNLYTTIKANNPTWVPKQIFAMLKEFGIDNDSKAPAKRKPKDLSFLKGKIRKADASDIARLCKAKGLDPAALAKFNPYRHVKDDVIYLPVYTNITDQKACGFLRVGLDGQLVKISGNREEKYPVIGNHGLFKTLDDRPGVIFTEAWRDACAAIACGFNATASSGGASTWRDDWLGWFKGKHVAIVMDADSAGNGGPLTDAAGKVRQITGAAPRAAERISTVAASVKIVTLPFEHKEKHGSDLYDYLKG